MLSAQIEVLQGDAVRVRYLLCPFAEGVVARLLKLGFALVYLVLLAGCAAGSGRAALTPEERLAEAQRPLFNAIENNDPATLKTLLGAGGDVNARNAKRDTLLHVAAEKGRVEIVRILLSAGAELMARGEAGYTPLHSAAWGGSKEAIELLLSRGAVLNVGATSGYTPLHSAIANVQVDAALLLLGKGADVNAKDNEGVTPLHLASEHKQRPVFELLLSKGAQVDAKDQFGRTPLLLTRDVEIARALILKGADPSIKGSDGLAFLDTPVYRDLTFEMNLLQYRKQAQVMELPLEARRHKVRAELAIKEGKFPDAIIEFNRLLEIAPWYPSAHFNKAAVLAEASDYRGAISSMKKYLQLVPNAPDATAAQDKIFEWEAKAGM